MSMDQRQFEALVQRMERFAVRAPGTYRSWVLALAVFGYTLLLALVIVLLLLLALLAFGLRDAAWLSVKLGLVVGALLQRVPEHREREHPRAIRPRRAHGE